MNKLEKIKSWAAELVELDAKYVELFRKFENEIHVLIVEEVGLDPEAIRVRFTPTSGFFTVFIREELNDQQLFYVQAVADAIQAKVFSDDEFIITVAQAHLPLKKDANDSP